VVVAGSFFYSCPNSNRNLNPNLYRCGKVPGRKNVQLAFSSATDENASMSSRETVIEFVSKLPEEMSLAEIAREVELLAGFQTARAQAGRGEGIPAQDARKLVDEWASK
jgi:hypothetical protein